MKATAPSLREQICAELADLKMSGALEDLDDILRALDGGSLQALVTIERLLGAQIALRNNRRLQAVMRSSRLPAVKTPGDFDFTFQPSLKREQIKSLHTLAFVERRENGILLGLPGVGKSHLAISLAIAAAHNTGGASTPAGWPISSRRSRRRRLLDASCSASRRWSSRACWWSTRSATCRSAGPGRCSSSSSCRGDTNTRRRC